MWLILMEKNIAPKNNAEAQKLIGKRVEYLGSSDNDRSGRGYIFPRTGTITNVVGNKLEIDGDMIHLSLLIEMIDITRS